MSQATGARSSHGLLQPRLGLAALVAVLVLSFAVMAACPPGVFNTWVAFLVMAMIPSQIICALVWRCEHPAALARLPQPLKALAYLALCAGLGGVAALASYYLVGGATSPPGPPLIMFVILSIVVTFWFAIVWGAWPLSALPISPVASGVLGVAFCYLVAYGLFHLLFDFSFMKGAPVYSEATDPHGAFMAWRPLAFGVTTVAVIAFLVLCEFRPVSLIGARPGSPTFGLAASAYVLLVASTVFYLGVQIAGMDLVQYLVGIPVPFIFGFFIVASLLEKCPAARMHQPLSGLVLALIAAAAGLAMHEIYLRAAPILTGRTLPSGPPAYVLELWLATAMLAVTFPLIVVAADFLGFWPLRRAGPGSAS